MKRSIVLLIALATLSSLAATRALAQAREVCITYTGNNCFTVAPPKLFVSDAGMPIPRAPDGKPDFTGVYAGPGFTHQEGPNDTDEPRLRQFDPMKMAPFAPGGEKLFYRPYSGDNATDDPISLCLPYGFTSQILVPYAQQWIQAPGWVVVRHEFQNNWSRAIPLDGRAHPKDLELTWGGDSVGHWEGDTLVIDTVGLKAWLLANRGNSEMGTIWHSDALHVIEHLKYISARVISYAVTIDDPKIWTGPWTEEFHMVKHPTWSLLEFVCQENDRCHQGHCTPADVQKESQ
jgi:hypothetical protein